jgi:competence protein ComEC
MRFVNYTLFRLAAAFTAGILTAHYTYSPPAFYILLLILPLLLAWHLISRKWLSPNHLFAILGYLAFFITGFAFYQAELPDTQPNYFDRYTAEDRLMRLRVKEVLGSDSARTRLICQVDQVAGQKTTGRLLVTVAHDPDVVMVEAGDVLFLKEKVRPIPAPQNPYQFDYASYMANQHVYRQCYTSSSRLRCELPPDRTLQESALNFRTRLESILDNSGLSPESIAMLNAFLLGNKKAIDKTTYKRYATAGAAHMLAVSGLHVGIIYLLVSYLLFPLYYLKYGYELKYVLIVIALWSFAFITGLSPSVSRAVTMFSCFAFARLVNRPTDSLNTLCLSWVILLLWDPFLIFRVGFQLSYAAVFSILYLQPKLAALYKPRFYLDQTIWGIITVSTAAQVGVSPLAIYYFNQFPGLFLLSNLLVVPLLGIIMAGSLLLVALTSLDLSFDLYVAVLDVLLLKMNSFIAWVSGQDSFIISGIYPDIIQVMFGVVLIFVLGSWLQKRQIKQLTFALLITVIIVGYDVWTTQSRPQSEMVVFHRSGRSIIGLRQGRSILLLKRDSIAYRNQFPVKDYCLNSKVKALKEIKMNNYLSLPNESWLIIDSTGVYPKITAIKILLIENPRINLERMIDSIKPKLIVADGSNAPYLVKKWTATSKSREIRFHYTGKQGALLINL